MKLQHAVQALVFLTSTVLLSSCNPFIPDLGHRDQPCLSNNTCQPGLYCSGGICVALLNPDGGSDGDGDGDGDNDAGDEDDCNSPELDCSAQNLPKQGRDEDGDGWGICCDCDDGRHETQPYGTEIPYNGHDDDCNEFSLDDDLDRDGYGGAQAGGPDCDDGDININPGVEEECNGLDDDCDDLTDEDMPDQACPLQEGVCQASVSLCAGAQGWSSCDYGDEYEVVELSCDNLDNDCDGLTDEEVEVLMIPEQGGLASDGVDNNCNGLVDEAGGVMVPVINYPNTWIDAYEMTVFDSPDCSGTRYGAQADDYPPSWPAEGDHQTELYACSLENVIPSGHLSYHRAQRACQAQGKQLCTTNWWEMACYHGANSYYPYAIIFVPGACNDALGGSGQAEATGSRDQCTAGNGTFDMSGNMNEWLGDSCDGSPELAVTKGDKYECVLCNNGQNCWACEDDDDRERIKRQSQCFDVYTGYEECWPKPAAPAFMGGRCCRQGS